MGGGREFSSQGLIAGHFVANRWGGGLAALGFWRVAAAVDSEV